jgi:hypothetical protein
MTALEMVLYEMGRQHRWTITIYSDDIFQPVFDALVDDWREPPQGFAKWKNGILNNLERRMEIKRLDDWRDENNRKIRKLWLKPAYRHLYMA